MKKKVIAFVSMIMAVCLLSFGSSVQLAAADSDNMSVNAKAYLLIDFDSGTEIMSSNKDERLQIASMVKIMTLDLIFDAIDAGTLSVDDDIPVSENASSMGGSQAFLDAGSSYKAEELIKSIIVASANDSCVAMAEHLAGSVESFVYKMNEKAAQLGMTNTNFVNCTGLPAPNEYSCASDVAKMSVDMMSHPQFFEYSGIWMFDLVHPSGRVTTLTNTNKLSRFYKGCDGGKTGFTSEALSCLSATAKRDGMRLLCVVIGAPSSKIRNQEVTKLLNHGFATYCNKTIVSLRNYSDLYVDISGGKNDKIKAAPAHEYSVFGLKSDRQEYTVEISTEHIHAPVKQGDKVGVLTVYKNGTDHATVDLVATESMDAMDYIDYIKAITSRW